MLQRFCSKWWQTPPHQQSMTKLFLEVFSQSPQHQFHTRPRIFTAVMSTHCHSYAIKLIIHNWREVNWQQTFHFRPTLKVKTKCGYGFRPNICAYFVRFCFIMHSCCIIVSMVGWTWWDWSLSFRNLSSFSALTLLVGSLTRKNPSPIWPIMCLVGR